MHRINVRWQQLVDQGLTIQLSDGQLRLLDLRMWTRVETHGADVLPEGSPPAGARLVARTIATTLLWKDRDVYLAWRSVETVREYRPEGLATPLHYVR